MNTPEQASADLSPDVLRRELDAAAINNPADATLRSFDTPYPRIYFSALGSWAALARNIPMGDRFEIDLKRPGHWIIQLGMTPWGNAALREGLENITHSDQFASLGNSEFIQQQLDALNLDPENSAKIIHLLTPVPIHESLNHKIRYVTILHDPVWGFLAPTIEAIHQAFGSESTEDQSFLAAKISESLDNAVNIHDGRELMASKFFLDLAANDFDGKNYADLPDRELLARIQNVIDSYFGFIGIDEYFSQSLFVICVLSGMDKAPLWRREIRHAIPPIGEFDPELIRRIRDLVRIDVALYDHQRTLFEETYSEFMMEFDQGVGNLCIDHTEMLRHKLSNG